MDGFSPIRASKNFDGAEDQKTIKEREALAAVVGKAISALLAFALVFGAVAFFYLVCLP